MELVHGSFGPAIAHSLFSLMAQKSYLALSGLDFKDLCILAKPHPSNVFSWATDVRPSSK